MQIKKQFALEEVFEVWEF